MLLFGFEFGSDFFSRGFDFSREPTLLGPGFGLQGDSLVGGFLFFAESVLVDGMGGFDTPISVASREVVRMGMFARRSDEGDKGT